MGVKLFDEAPPTMQDGRVAETSLHVYEMGKVRDSK